MHYKNIEEPCFIVITLEYILKLSKVCFLLCLFANLA